MFPAASAVSATAKPVQPADQQSTLRSSQQHPAETARASAGEVSAANLRNETVQAVKAAEQSAVAARLRDQEKSEQSERRLPFKDAPTGPPPSFEESPLERQARLAFDPPDTTPISEPAENNIDFAGTPEPAESTDPPPTPRERAEISFAETRTMSAPKDLTTVDIEI